MITPAHVQHAFASHNLALQRYAQAPELCDRSACQAIWTWGGKHTYLAAAGKTDFVVVVFPTIRDAVRVAEVGTSDRRRNAVLFYLASARQRLAIVRRIFSGL